MSTENKSICSTTADCVAQETKSAPAGKTITTRYSAKELSIYDMQELFAEIIDEDSETKVEDKTGVQSTKVSLDTLHAILASGDGYAHTVLRAIDDASDNDKTNVANENKRVPETPGMSRDAWFPTSRLIEAVMPHSFDR